MGKKVIILLLIVSLALNAFFLGSYLTSEIAGTKEEIMAHDEENAAIIEQFAKNREALEACALELEIYKNSLVELESRPDNCPFTFIANATMQAPAVVQRVEIIEQGTSFRQRFREEGAMI
ncbi:MAG: peptidase S16, partial [Candidatus Thermoplasmatota archaeon]|nr:peptidase S16 [Candidatus Thermoplasmatota archaeon]